MVGKSICAFANTTERIIFLGIADDGMRKRISEDDVEEIANIAHSCKPSVYPEIR